MDWINLAWLRDWNMALTPDEETVYCGGCGIPNQGNPCAACRAKPGGGFTP